MQARLSFNAGELAPELGCRSDLEKFMFGCEVLENWQVGQLGGIKRRRGMRSLVSAISSESRLIPYIYSYAEGEDLRFLIELVPTGARVMDLEGNIVKEFIDANKYSLDPPGTRFTQINKLLILTSLSTTPMVLQLDEGVWRFDNFSFKHNPWRYTNKEPMDTEVVASFSKDSIWSVTFDSKEPAENTAREIEESDILRISYNRERREIFESAKNIASRIVPATEGVPNTASYYKTYAVPVYEGVSYWVCYADFPEDGYQEGLESPANYANAFRKADSSKGFESVKPVYSIGELGAIAKNTKIAIKSESWRYWTCIKSYSTLPGTSTDFADYPEYFIEGLPIGDTYPCKGTWAFKCSGTWYGSYAVKRCYNEKTLRGEWELRGVSTSYNDAPANTGIEGNEKTEECMMRLFLLASKRMGDNVANGLPLDVCHNCLVIDSYVHDIVLKAIPALGEDGEPTGAITWSSLDKFPPPAGSRIRTRNWSWAAFSDRYGYPLLSLPYNQRLVFASTEAQPQTIWMSRVDDLNNFAEGDEDDAAIPGLTLNTSTQDPICWLKQNKRALLVGTTSSEHVVEPGSTVGGITAANAMSQVHSDRGSDDARAISMPDKVVYISRGGKRAYEYGYNYEADGYISRDLSLLAPHIGREHKGLRVGSSIEEPDVVALFTLGDGQLALCTYNSLQEVRAWHRWNTDGFILDVCGMPNGRGEDKVFLIVERDGTPWIEVVDENSPYYDADGRDYASTVITNSLRSSLEEPVRNKPNPPIAICFGDDLETQSVEISSDGGRHWCGVNSAQLSITKGWHSDLVTNTENKFERKVGVRITGEQGAEILAIQA